MNSCVVTPDRVWCQNIFAVLSLSDLAQRYFIRSRITCHPKRTLYQNLPKLFRKGPKLSLKNTNNRKEEYQVKPTQRLTFPHSGRPGWVLVLSPVIESLFSFLARRSSAICRPMAFMSFLLSADVMYMCISRKRPNKHQLCVNERTAASLQDFKHHVEGNNSIMKTIRSVFKFCLHFQTLSRICCFVSLMTSSFPK